MTDFITEALDKVNFCNFTELQEYLHDRAVAGKLDDIATKLEASGWTHESADRMRFFVERMKINSFKV